MKTQAFLKLNDHHHLTLAISVSFHLVVLGSIKRLKNSCSTQRKSQHSFIASFAESHVDIAVVRQANL